MAQNKKRKQGNRQQFLSPERYLRERARSLSIGKCYISDYADEAGSANIIVTRLHTGGRISIGVFLVDMLCLGVKDTLYNLRMEEEELNQFLQNLMPDHHECTYEEAHNRIYGAIAFAREGGIEPHKDFRLTQYLLEEDTDDIPLIEYQYGRDGKHVLVCDSYLEASRYLSTLHKHLGDNFEYIVRNEDHDFDDDDDDDDDDDIANDIPVYMADCLEDLDAEELQYMAICLGIELDTKASLEKQRRQYVQSILDNPKEVLMRLPYEDIVMLEELAMEPVQERLLWHPDNSLEPLMYHCCLIDFHDKEQWGTSYRVTEDFWKAVRPHLKEAHAEEANQARLSVEAYIMGLVNLYGVVSIKDIKSYLAKMLDMPEDAASDLYALVLSHSLLLPTLLRQIAEDKKITNDDYDAGMAFASRFGWDSTTGLIKAIALRHDTIPNRKTFTVDEVIGASAVIPDIPNRQKAHFKKFLCARLGYDEMEADLICHNLWLCAQHEENPASPHGSYLDYFAKKVIEDAKRKPSRATINEGLQALKDFLNALPRWSLSGYAPDEIQD